MSVLFKLISVEDSNILINFDTKEFNRIRKLAIQCILCTDMRKHFELLNEFEKRLKLRNTDNIPLSKIPTPTPTLTPSSNPTPSTTPTPTIPFFIF